MCTVNHIVYLANYFQEYFDYFDFVELLIHERSTFESSGPLLDALTGEKQRDNFFSFLLRKECVLWSPQKIVPMVIAKQKLKKISMTCTVHSLAMFY